MRCLKNVGLIKDRVNDGLKDQLKDVQQYSRRYSVIVKGMNVEENENKNTLTNEVKKKSKNVTPLRISTTLINFIEMVQLMKMVNKT